LGLLRLAGLFGFGTPGKAAGEIRLLNGCQKSLPARPGELSVGTFTQTAMHRRLPSRRRSWGLCASDGLAARPHPAAAPLPDRAKSMPSFSPMRSRSRRLNRTRTQDVF
jgi:hypothetical protein